MNREIFSKAKRKCNGEWVEGYYVPHIVEGKIVHHFILTGEADLVETEDDELILKFYWEEIDPNTICQYTGLTDKNGKKIWENDIVEERYRGVTTMRYHVLWDFKEASWMLETKSSARYGMYAINQRKFEVIGNIFDNPELLEVK